MTFKLAIAFSFIFLLSCTKQKLVCQSAVDIQVLGNKNFTTVKTADFTAYGRVDQGDTYEWIGPNNFTEKGQRIAFDINSPIQGGKYGVRTVSKDKTCLSDYVYFEVTIADNIAAQCFTDQESNVFNTSEYSDTQNMLISKSYATNKILYTASTESTYDYGYLYYTFAGNFEPAVGELSVNPSYSMTVGGVTSKVSIAYYSDNGYMYFAKSGTVTITEKTGSFYATFCDLTFEPENSYQDPVVISAKISVY